MGKGRIAGSTQDKGENTMTDEQVKQILDGISGMEKRVGDIEAMAKETNNKLLNAIVAAKPVSKLGISEESCRKFMDITKALLMGDIAQAKVVSGGADATGAYLIPTEVADTILSIAPKYGVVRRYATIWPMGAKKVDVAKQIANLYDYVIDEGVSNTPSASGNLFGQVALSAKRHGTIVPYTDDMVDYASVNIVDFLVTEIARAIGKGTDSLGFLGKTSAGTAVASMPGIFANADATAITLSGTTFSTLTTDNMDDMIAGLDNDVLDGARFYMNSKVLYGVVAKLKENSGTSAGYVYTPASGSNPAMWRGFPIELVGQLPGTTAVNTKFIGFGNLKYLIIGEAKKMMMDIAREATIVEGSTTYNLWQQGMKALKVEEMIDIKVAFGQAFAYAKTTAS